MSGGARARLSALRAPRPARARGNPMRPRAPPQVAAARGAGARHRGRPPAAVVRRPALHPVLEESLASYLVPVTSLRSLSPQALGFVMLCPKLPSSGPKELQTATGFSERAGGMQGEQTGAEEPCRSKLQLATLQTRYYCSLGDVRYLDRCYLRPVYLLRTPGAACEWKSFRAFLQKLPAGTGPKPIHLSTKVTLLIYYFHYHIRGV